jgi:hypothetical protein
VGQFCACGHFGGVWLSWAAVLVLLCELSEVTNQTITRLRSGGTLHVPLLGPLGELKLCLQEAHGPHTIYALAYTSTPGLGSSKVCAWHPHHVVTTSGIHLGTAVLWEL